MSEPLIHIGYHKTGTTWLQRNLFNGENSGFYPLGKTQGSEKAGRHGPKSLGFYFMFSADGDLLSPYENRTDRVRELLRGNELPEDRVGVISNERLSGSPHASGFDSSIIADRIHDAFPDARILIVIREQRSMIISSYYQYLKRGGVHSLKNYILPGYDGAVPKFSLRYFKYNELIEYYCNLFGREKVLVLPYELFLENATDFIEKICEFSNVAVPQSLPVSERINDKGKGWQMSMQKLRILNGLTSKNSINDHSIYAVPGLRTIINMARNTTMNFWPESSIEKLSERNRQEVDKLISDYYAESNRLVSELINTDLKSNFDYQ